MPGCSAIIVTHNSADSILFCLEALAHADCEIIVVDNSSSDDTVGKVEGFAQQRPACLIVNRGNFGFGAAVNIGADHATGEVFLLLNPDAVAEGGAVAALIGCLGSTAAGAAGGALLESDGQPQRGFVFRRLPTLSALMCEVLLINHLWPHNPVNRRYRCLDADYSTQQPVEQPAGACLAVTRQAWNAIGGFDPQFRPVWFEDVDLCNRILSAGYGILYCPAARFHHSGAHSVGQLSFRDKQTFWYANMLRYAGKHFSAWKTGLLRFGILAGMFMRTLGTLLGQKPVGASRTQAIAAYADVSLRVVGFGS